MSGPEQPGQPNQETTVQRRAEQPSSGLDARRVAIGAGAALLVLAVAGIAFGAARLGAFGPTADRQGAQGPGVARSTPGGPGDLRRGTGRGLPGPIDQRRGLPSLRGSGIPGAIPAVRQITISAINGSDVTVGTVDGWTRTISVSSSTTITRAGQTIAVTDLKVGDAIRFHQQRNADGTYTVTAIEVVLPHVAGQVTATTSDSVTVERPDGTTTVVHVGSGTTYRVRGVQSATLADISVGMLIVAQGTQNADGSLQAVAIDAAAKR